MKNVHVKGIALVGALTAAFVGLWLMAPASGSEAGRGVNPRTAGRGASVAAGQAATRRGGRGTGPAVDGTEVAQASTAAPAAVESEAVRRARELFNRIQAAVGPRPGLPADLEHDLIAFLGDGAEGREAFFALAWDPSVSRMVVGHVKLLLMGLKDAELRATLVAALEKADPSHALRVEMAGKMGDPANLVAEMRSAPAGRHRAERVCEIDRDVCRDPQVASFLLETARQDPDEGTRLAAYNRLAYAGVAGTTELLLSVAGDSGRSLAERGGAAHALELNSDLPSADSLVALYADSPVEIRPFIATLMAKAPADSRVDDVLLDAMTSLESAVNLRKAASSSIGRRLCSLPRADARELGDHAAVAVRTMAPEASAEALKSLGGGVIRNEPLREAVKDLHRTAPAGGAIQAAIAATPALRMAAGLSL